jgi:hypothetical protein
MPDDLGRVNLISHFLDRGAPAEPYQGRHARKHRHETDRAGEDEESADSDPGKPAAGSRVDLRI